MSSRKIRSTGGRAQKVTSMGGHTRKIRFTGDCAQKVTSMGGPHMENQVHGGPWMKGHVHGRPHMEGQVHRAVLTKGQVHGGHTQKVRSLGGTHMEGQVQAAADRGSREGRGWAGSSLQPGCSGNMASCGHEEDKASWDTHPEPPAVPSSTRHNRAVRGTSLSNLVHPWKELEQRRSQAGFRRHVCCPALVQRTASRAVPD